MRVLALAVLALAAARGDDAEPLLRGDVVPDGSVAGAVVQSTEARPVAVEDGMTAVSYVLKDRAGCAAVGECEKCSKQELRWDAGEVACRATGYKQLSKCTVLKNTTICTGPRCPSAEALEEAPPTREDTMFVQCAPVNAGPDRVMRFETVMVVGAVGSLYTVWQRKKQAYQRLSNIVNN